MSGVVRMNLKELDEVIKKTLNSKEHDTVCYRSLNKTVSSVRAEGRKAIRGKYNIKAGDVVKEDDCC